MTLCKKFAYLIAYLLSGIQVLRYLLLTLLIIYLPVTFAQPRQSLVPGGIAMIELDPNDTRGYLFRKKPVLVTQIDGKSVAVIGLPLSLSVGEQFIEKSDATQVHRKYFEVAAKQYSTQHIEIKDKRKVNPYASDMDRILEEKKAQAESSFLTTLKPRSTWIFCYR